MSKEWIDYLVRAAIELIDVSGVATETDLINLGATKAEAWQALDTVGEMDGYEVGASRRKNDGEG